MDSDRGGCHEHATSELLETTVDPALTTDGSSSSGKEASSIVGVSSGGGVPASLSDLGGGMESFGIVSVGFDDSSAACVIEFAAVVGDVDSSS